MRVRKEDRERPPLSFFQIFKREEAQIMSVLKWLDKNLEKVIVAAATTVLLSASFLGVVTRYGFNMSLTWTEEVSLFALIWLAYFGAAISVTRRRHLRIELLPMLLLGKRGQKIVNILVNVVFFGFALFIVKGTLDMTLLAYRTNQVFAATGIRRWTSVAAVPCAFLVLALRVFQDTLRQFAEYKAMDKTGEPSAGTPAEQ
ncbi:MAG: TRAP transporter small permease [Synergistaceae bacterium]|jgi:TRAP-type C4-dicarboxylate transport system permease small subunit|nr:TRAP transporter small permease [Synergistaceae bacterium]